jgi:type II secretory pathway pseudopilin PulG
MRDTVTIHKRSLTLFETLIAIILVLAMGALIFPSLVDNLDERTFESAADTTNNQLMMARAHAQATGAPVEVTYKAGASQVRVRVFTPWMIGPSNRSDIAGPFSILNRKSPRQAANLANGEATTSDDIDEAWACMEVARSVRITSRAPAEMRSETQQEFARADATSGRGGAPPLQPDYETLDDLGKGQDVRLAVFLPDGSALLNDPVWIDDGKGRRGKLSINPWSGLPIFQRLGAANDAIGAKEDESDLPPVSDECPPER